jgi:hypothetical protein
MGFWLWWFVSHAGSKQNRYQMVNAPVGYPDKNIAKQRLHP